MSLPASGPLGIVGRVLDVVALLGGLLVGDLDALDDLEPWRRDGLCREYPAVNFFPPSAKQARAAQAVCAECLVVDECRAYACAHDLIGVWGGELFPRRQRRVRQLPPQAYTPRQYCTDCGGSLPRGRMGRCCACEETRNDPGPKPGVVAA